MILAGLVSGQADQLFSLNDGNFRAPELLSESWKRYWIPISPIPRAGLLAPPPPPPEDKELMLSAKADFLE